MSNMKIVPLIAVGDQAVRDDARAAFEALTVAVDAHIQAYANERADADLVSHLEHLRRGVSDALRLAGEAIERADVLRVRLDLWSGLLKDHLIDRTGHQPADDDTPAA
jgi:hypothetical protein